MSIQKKTYLLFSISLFFCCNAKKTSENITANNLDHYSLVKESKYYGVLSYSFYGSREKDSIEWKIPNVPRIMFFISGKEIYRIDVRNYRGTMPDSLEFTKLNFITLENSVLVGNKGIFANTEISLIEMYNSFFYDSTINLKIFKNIRIVDIENCKTNFVINDSLPIEQMSYMESDSLYPAREIHIEFDKLPNLKALSFKCRNCKIDIPHDSLNLIYKKDENGIQITKGSYPIIPELNQN